MQIIPFPAHYQSVYTNFDISSFSLISCTVKGPQLHRNRGPFASPFESFQASFRPPICVSKIQTTDYQNFENVTKIAYLHPSDCALQISQAEKPKMNK